MKLCRELMITRHGRVGFHQRGPFKRGRQAKVAGGGAGTLAPAIIPCVARRPSSVGSGGLSRFTGGGIAVDGSARGDGVFDRSYSPSLLPSASSAVREPGLGALLSCMVTRWSSRSGRGRRAEPGRCGVRIAISRGGICVERAESVFLRMIATHALQQRSEFVLWNNLSCRSCENGCCNEGMNCCVSHSTARTWGGALATRCASGLSAMRGSGRQPVPRAAWRLRFPPQSIIPMFLKPDSSYTN
jgi:hypothetical protein